MGKNPSPPVRMNNVFHALSHTLNQQYRRIGLLDSGVGGLTVLAPLTQKIVSDFVYLADTKHVPYGDRSAQELQELAVANVQFLLAQDVEIIIIACNTLSAIAFTHLKKSFPHIPIIGIIELVAQRAAQTTRSNNIGLMATTATITSGAYQNYFNKYHPYITLTSTACPALVPLIEQYPHDIKKLRTAIQGCCSQFNTQPIIDTLILGSTHYSLIEREIKKQCMPEVTLISAQTVFEELMMDLSGDINRQPTISFFVTGNVQEFAQKALSMIPLPPPRVIQSAHITLK